MPRILSGLGKWGVCAQVEFSLGQCLVGIVGIEEEVNQDFSSLFQSDP